MSAPVETVSAPPERAGVLSPGIYRIAELSDLLGVSRSSVERYIDRYTLETQTIMHLNKPTKGVVLDDEQAALLSQVSAHAHTFRDVQHTPMNRSGLTTNAPEPPMSNHPPEPPAVAELREKIDSLQSQLLNATAQAARYEGELSQYRQTVEAQAQVIAAKDETITAVRSEVQSLKATMALLESHQRHPAIEYQPTPPQPVGIISRIRGWFS